MKNKKKNLFSSLLSNRVYFLLLLLVIVVIIMSIISPYFWDIQVILDIVRMGTVLLLLGMGQTLVITAGSAGIDLSNGAVLSLSGVLFGLMVQNGMNIWLAGALTIIVGGLLGSINGLTIALLGVPPLIGTLGTMWIYNALALVITKGFPISGFPEKFEFIGSGYILGIPSQLILVGIPMIIILSYLMNRTHIGRMIYLIGVNKTAARFAGIPVGKIRFLTYAISGLLAGLGAVVMSSWLMASRPDAGIGLEMQSITVAVLGGTSITGGFGNLIGTIIAVLIVTLLASGLQLGGVDTIWQLGILGVILIATVAINQLINKMHEKSMGI